MISDMMYNLVISILGLILIVDQGRKVPAFYKNFVCLKMRVNKNKCECGLLVFVFKKYVPLTGRGVGRITKNDSG